LLAEKTGWTIDYVLWEVPLSILCQANHVWLWMSGVNVVFCNSINKNDKKEIAGLLGIQI
jgi:hypothetical protein